MIKQENSTSSQNVKDKKANSSLRASVSKRGNPQSPPNATQPTNLNSMDCHADFDKSARNDGVKLAPKLSIVIPCYNEEAVIAHTYKALCEKLDSLIAQNVIAKDSFLCFVDDGSKDKTCEILLSLRNATNTDKNSPSLRVSKASVAIHKRNLKTTSINRLPRKNSLTLAFARNDNAHCHTEATALHRHTERSEVSKDKNAHLQNHLDSSVASLLKNDNETMLYQNDNINPHKIIKLTKNYGHQNALLAGLDFVKDKCDCVVSMDCDLQDDINAIDEMLVKFKNGAEVVYGVRKARDKDTAFKKYTALGFYKFMHLMGVKIIYNHADYRLLSARACENLLEFREVNLFLRGIVPLLGHKSEVVYYERAARFAGTSKYPLGKMLSFALNGITSFSITPLRVMSVIGVILCAMSVIYGAYALYIKIFTAQSISGWTSTILVLLFFGGMQFLGLGIIGEYIGKIYAEVKHRPRYFVDEIL